MTTFAVAPSYPKSTKTNYRYIGVIEMEKIKAFFKSKIVRIICAVLFVVGSTGLIVGGVTQETVNGVLVAVVAAISAIGALITIVSSFIKK